MALANVPPDRTLLEVLREDLGCTGTKEGCGEGDCGACTVVIGEARDGAVHYSAINSCIRLAHSIDGMALWTVEDLSADPLIQPLQACAPCAEQPLHPVQQAMVECHASQCGFCTPGFVMSLFSMYQRYVVPMHHTLTDTPPVTRELAQQELSGNLCRCTGYRPIFDAAQRMTSLPPVGVNEPELLQKLEHLVLDGKGLDKDLTYISPPSQAQLLAARAAHPQAQVVAGCTDVGLWITKQHRHFPVVLDVTRATELRRITQERDHLAIGAAVSLTEAFEALVAIWPQLETFASRFAGLPVRNSGTLGGNIANGSPIGDSMPLLIALGAQVVLASTRGERTLPLENLYIGYRKSVMAQDELLVRILVPQATSTSVLRAYKISKRWDDDISAVCLALRLDIRQGRIQQASIGAGGVAPTPARACQTETALVGQAWNESTVAAAIAVLVNEFTPISDMRASSAYRRTVLGHLLQRFWLETQGQHNVSLETLNLEEARP